MADFAYEDMLPIGPDRTDYRLVTTEGVRTIEGPGGRTFLEVDPGALRRLTDEAMHDIAHFLRPAHLAQLRSILDDPEASNNDRFVALDLLKNANIAAAGVLPMCQDTGTAVVMGKRGQHVLTTGEAPDEEAIAHGVYDAYTRLNLRYSQMAPVTTWEERNTGSNLPAQIELYADTAPGHETTYKLLFMAKGGGSANKSFLYQETKAVLNEQAMMAFLDARLRALGTAACPPYHLAIVIGGTSAEFALKTAKYASAKYLDDLPTTGDAATARGFRDPELEAKVLELTRAFGIGAQFGGKYFCHDVRVVRLPRHGASLPVAIAVSCSADRQALAKITAEGVFIEALERDPARFLPETTPESLAADAEAADDVVSIDLGRPMEQVLAELGRHPVKTRLSLTGTLVVARDIAHAKIKERLDAGEEMPQYLKDHPVYYAGPAKTPEGMASGSFGPTTAGRMDSYVEQFQAAGGSKVMLAKGNRSKQVTDACAAHGGFYLGSIGGPAARLAQDCITKVEVLEYAELGMEAVWRIEVQDFPAFIVVDDKGHDFFATVTTPLATTIPREDIRMSSTESSPQTSSDAAFDDVLAANRDFAADFHLSGFDGIARAGIGMLTCMDSRIDPLGMIGLVPGDAKIIRNPGARLTPIALEAMVLGVNLLQVRRILVVPHTRCAVATSTAQEVTARVAASSGVADPGMEFHVVEDQIAALRDDVRTLTEHPLIAGQAQVAGFVYDVDTGLLERRA